LYETLNTSFIYSDDNDLMIELMSTSIKLVKLVTYKLPLD